MSTAVVLDCETTGLSSDNHRIIEIAIVEWDTGAVLLDTRVNPCVFIPEEITRITGITDADVRDAPLFPDIAAQVAQLISEAEAVIGYNPYFDQGFVDSEMRRITPERRPLFKWPTIVCSKRTWDAYEPRQERNLQNAFKRFVAADGFEGAHGALADVMATRAVLLSQIEHFKLDGKKWDEFDPQRAKWWGPSFHVLLGEKEDQLILNFGKNKGKPVHEVDDGFWRWVTEKDFPDHVLALALKMRELIPQWNEPDNLRRALFAWAKDSRWRGAR